MESRASGTLNDVTERLNPYVVLVDPSKIYRVTVPEQGPVNLVLNTHTQTHKPTPSTGSVTVKFLRSPLRRHVGLNPSARKHLPFPTHYALGPWFYFSPHVNKIHPNG